MVTNIIIKILILIGLVLPIIILTFNRIRKNYINIILFYAYYIIWCFFNSPLRANFDIFDSKWNWEGKMMAFVFSIIFILVFNKRLQPYNFFTILQKEKSTKPIFLVIGIILILATIFSYFTGDKVAFSYDTLAFQISMPGLDEEFAHRGIMMGLLCSALQDHISIGRIKIISPAVLVTATLFGLIHGFPLTPYLDWKFDYFSFVYTFVFGLIWGWMVLKCRSIVAPTLSHSLTNFISTLMTMIK